MTTQRTEALLATIDAHVAELAKLKAERDELRAVLLEIMASVDADNRQEAMLCPNYRLKARALLAKGKSESWPQPPRQGEGQ